MFLIVYDHVYFLGSLFNFFVFVVLAISHYTVDPLIMVFS
jgi:hypothetical protein